MTHNSYANPAEQFCWQSPGIVQFGADGETVSYTLKGPKGRKGLVRDIQIHITEDMVGTTTVPEILVEAVASALGAVVGTYARFRLGTTAILGYLASSTPRRARNLVVGNGAQQTWEDFSGHVKLETAFIPDDTAYIITLLAGSGGSETGAGQVFVHIDWF